VWAAAVWTAAVAAVVAFMLATALSPVQDLSASVMFLGIVVSLALVGALLMTRVPGNRIGAMLLAAGILLTTGVGLGTYAALGVDRRFDRGRYHGERTAAAFRDRLRGQIDMQTVTTDLSATVRGAISLSRLGIWLRAGRAQR